VQPRVNGADDAAGRGRPISYKAVAAATAGTALESFDIAIYGFMAVTISKLFFPTADPALSLLMALGSYGVSFVMRPLGAAFLGSYADRRGRKAALSLSLTLMGVGSFAIAIMPTYAQIGFLAPIGIIAARLLQGFSIGGEQASAATFLAEQHPDRRGEFTSWLFTAAGLTVILASGIGTILTTSLDPEQLESWGWRLPFLFGAIIYPLGVYVRRKTRETVEFSAAAKTDSPIRDAVGRQGGDIALAAILYAAGPILSYLILFMPTFAATQLGLSLNAAFSAGIIAGFTMAITAPFFGILSDRIGRFRLMFPTAIAILVLSWPTFALLVAYPSWSTLVVAQILFATLAAAYSSSSPALLAEMFPVSTRTTSIALAGALSITVFGGFAPLILAALVAGTGDKTSPSLYVMLGAAMAAGALLRLRFRSSTAEPPRRSCSRHCR